jgi:uncharacterized protein
MHQSEIIRETVSFVKQSLENAEGGHDWWHIYRVRKTALHIASCEKADPFIVDLGALLHDIADAKFHGGDEDVGPRRADDFLRSLGVDEHIRDHIVGIVSNVSFKGGSSPRSFSSPELDVVQDADRLDAIGAIGIARTFSYGGFKGRAMYNPDVPPRPGMSREEYRKTDGPSINHFYEKLLLLKDKMNTETGRKMAAHRHEYMEKFLTEFYGEWDGSL